MTGDKVRITWKRRGNARPSGRRCRVVPARFVGGYRVVPARVCTPVGGYSSSSIQYQHTVAAYGSSIQQQHTTASYSTVAWRQ
eukprot:3767747-Rhodomonas_salina.1